jgi:uncharacterized protein
MVLGAVCDGDGRSDRDSSRRHCRATQDEIDEAFWQACHGGQLRAAQFLLARGANIQARPGYAETPAIEVAAEPDTRRQQLVTWMGELGA